ncbi:hypothetical protein H5410_042203 [Solanum commersonii]|uniref:Uncharacterized protein n=1 Tax=Solanum commersonii TaxID=4109 RepID=A0A9J5XU31_SOLCO|nr:hypothetical protein H5410_042203 [Solanum commersonii]
MGKPTYFKGQMIPEQVNPSLCQIFVCYCPWIFVDLEFRRDFCQKISWTSIKTLVIELVGPDGKTNPFSSHRFLVIQNSNVIFAEIFHGRPLRP